MSEQDDQFSLVSLEKSNKAANSYSSMSRRARGEADSTLNVNEKEAKEKLAPPPPPPPKKEAPKEAPKKQAKKKAPEKLPSVGGDESPELEEILAKMNELARATQQLLANASVAAKSLAVMIITPMLPLLNKLLKLLNIPLQFINLLAKKINARMSNKPMPTQSPDAAATAAAAEPEPEPEPEPIDAKTATFSDMIELNIAFMDNMKKPLYKKKQGMAQKLGAMEEDLIVSNALLAISECAEFTKELPSPAEGIYAGQKIYDIMSNVSKEDVAIFLGFVKAYPGKYIGKEWKISETFATWLINNAPIAT